ncbi:MAG: nicotinamide mononucleotide transporter [Bacteroidaceae bacterium]|nr:nicotinamide mononucleotide transporter [Bacteroidaceae bacterium]
MNYLEIIGTVVGLIYLWLEYKASIWLWLAGFVMPAIYVVVYYQAGLYADFGINIYYLLASIYGIYCWLKNKENSNKENESNHSISRMPTKKWGEMGIYGTLLTILIALVLIRYTDSTVPWLDSFTTALSILAMWMLARKYVEQWLVWMVVDAVSAGLYVYKELYFTAGLYALYTVIAYIGYKKWIQLMLFDRKRSS